MTAATAGKRANPRRRVLVEAALRLIGRHGAGAVTHRMVAHEAGLPLASTTYYFDSKAALVEEALALVIERSIEAARAHTAVAGPIDRATLVERIVAFARQQLEDPDALLAAQFELMLEAGRRPHLRPLADRWNAAYLRCFEGLVAAAGAADAREAARMLVTYLDGALIDQLGAPVAEFADSRLRPQLRLLVDHLVQPGPAA